MRTYRRAALLGGLAAAAFLVTGAVAPGGDSAQAKPLRAERAADTETLASPTFLYRLTGNR
jgi:hypothetical protein